MNNKDDKVRLEELPSIENLNYPNLNNEVKKNENGFKTIKLNSPQSLDRSNSLLSAKNSFIDSTNSNFVGNAQTPSATPYPEVLMSNTLNNPQFINNTPAEPQATGILKQNLISPAYEPSQSEIYQKNLKIFYRYIGFHLPIFILSVVFLIFYFVGNSLLTYSEIPYFANIAKVWATGPILSISENCTNPVENNLLSDTWQGTVSGCSCSGSLTKGACGKSKRGRGCSSVGMKNPVRFTTWKGKKICVERMKSHYLDLDIVSNPNGCSSGKRSCGIIDSKNNYLCIDKKDNCPINSVSIFYDESYKPLANNDYAVEFAANYAKNFTKATMVFSTKFPENKIPSFFKTSTGIPCKNPYFENMNYLIYLLSFYRGRQICYQTIADTTKTLYETEYTEIDSMAKLTYYKENTIYDILNSLPKFSIAELEMDISLYQRSNYGLSLTCLKDIKSQQLSDEMISELNGLIEFEEYIRSMSANMVFALLFFVFEFILVFLSFGPISKGKKSKKYSNVTMTEIWIYVFFLVPILIFCIFNLAYNSKISRLLGDKQYLGEYFKDPKCVDEFTNDLFIKSVGNMLSAQFYYNSMNIITYIVLIIHILFVFLGINYIQKLPF